MSFVVGLSYDNREMFYKLNVNGKSIVTYRKKVVRLS